MQSAYRPEISTESSEGGRVAQRRQLGPHFTSRIEGDEETARVFLIAGVAALLSRLHQRSTLHIASRSAVRTMFVDESQSFAALLSAAKLPGEGAKSGGAKIDASAGVTLAAAAVDDPVCAHPAFTLQKEAAQEPGAAFTAFWTLTATTSGDDEAGAERLILYLANLLESASQDDRQAVLSLPLATEAEALALYTKLNATVTAHEEKSVQRQIAAQARIDPAALAVVFGNEALTYGQLEEQSDRLATVLTGMGASQKRPVAVCIPRGEQLPVVLLATLKAGSFFVPLDPTHPRQRLIDILNECKPAVVVVTTATAMVLAGSPLPLFLLDGQAKTSGYTEAIAQTGVQPKCDDTVYTIYTSGTTGKPKGVMIPHGALINFLHAAKHEPGMRRGERWLAVATISFDISLMDMFLPLVTGGTLVIASSEQASDPAQLTKLIDQQHVDCMQATPATWRMLLAQGWKGKPGLRMLCGGEAIPRDLVNALLSFEGEAATSELWNCYGPTETTIYSSFLRLHRGEGPVPIGPPTANTTFWIADGEGRLLPPEIPGELYIGGDGVAKGYFERPELTSEKFMQNRWMPNTQQRMFRTGDAARLRADGTMEFFGRLDGQIKLRGYRIELGEIESVLRTHPTVEDAAVVLREDLPGEPWLVAYIVTSAAGDRQNTDEKAKTLRAYAARSLPAYMLPSRLVDLPKLPLTGSGKVDRKALRQLPAPEEAVPAGRANEAEQKAQSVDTVERALLRIFREVLRSERFGPDDNFFDHGGYSLMAVRLFARVAKELGTELPITTLFEAPTVRKLAAFMRRGETLATVVPIRASGKDAPFFLVQSYLLYGLAGSMVPPAHPVYGLREAGRSGETGSLLDQIHTCVFAIEKNYPTGIVHLGGWCAAAPLTVEIARRLREHGRTIGMIALFDAEAPGYVAGQAGRHPRLARWRATLAYHWNRLRQVKWRERLEYLVERGSQHALQVVEWFYLQHRPRIREMQRWLPFLPHIVFHNRWTQIATLVEERPLPVPFKVFLFRASDVIILPGSDEALGWREIAQGGVEVIFVPGHHESMFHEPQFTALRRQFGEALQKSSGSPVEQNSKSRAS